MGKFIKRKEDFVCAVCGRKVKGDGYTDHCPFCLWSKHVDIFPGDRQEECGGLMEPMGIEKKKGQWRLLYRCQKCSYQRWNKATKNDKLSSL